MPEGTYLQGMADRPRHQRRVPHPRGRRGARSWTPTSPPSPGARSASSTPMVSLIAEDGRVTGAWAGGPRRPHPHQRRQGRRGGHGRLRLQPGHVRRLAMPRATACLGTVRRLPQLHRRRHSRRFCAWAPTWMQSPSSVYVQPLPAHGRPGGWHTPTRSAATPTATTSTLPSRSCAWMPAGDRFHNESAPYDFVHERHFAASVRPASASGTRCGTRNWKDDMCRASTPWAAPPFTMQPEGGSDHDAFAGHAGRVDRAGDGAVRRAAGCIVKADTLDALADKLWASTGEDEGERSWPPASARTKTSTRRVDPDFGKEPFRLSELRTPPFYASVKSCGLTLCTHRRRRGERRACSPMAEDGAVIEGVYAGGQRPGRVLLRTAPTRTWPPA